MRDANNHKVTAASWDAAASTFAAHAARLHVPLGGTFELTARCNLRCKMCYIRLSDSQAEKLGRELSASEWIELGREAAKAGMVNLLLTGGEPLLREDFAEIYTALCQMGFIITLNTNATLMSEEHARLFSQCPPTNISVTLYGACPETYGKTCGDPNGFEKTIRGLEMLSKLPTNIEIRTTFIRDNMSELDDLRDIAHQYTKRYAINPMVFKPVRGATADVEDCRMEPSQCMDITMANYAYYLSSGEPEENLEMMESTVAEQHSAITRDYGLDLPPAILTCLAAKATCWLSWDGKMLPCGSFTSPYTLPLEEGFLNAWNRLPMLLEGIERPAECRECELADSCPNCPANLQAETGRLDGFSPYLCALSKERAARYAKGI